MITLTLALWLNHAQAWEPLTKVGDCSQNQNACTVLEKDGSFRFRMVSAPARHGKKKLTQLQIEDLKNKTVQTFKVDAVNFKKPDEPFLAYTLNLRPTGEKDLAVYAFNSAREGETFYYLLYSPKTRQFVMSEGTFPKLRWDGKQFVSELQNTKFELSSELKLKEKL